MLSSWSALGPTFIAADDIGNLYVTSSVGASITKYTYRQPPVAVESTSRGAIKSD